MNKQNTHKRLWYILNQIAEMNFIVSKIEKYRTNETITDSYLKQMKQKCSTIASFIELTKKGLFILTDPPIILSPQEEIDKILTTLVCLFEDDLENLFIERINKEISTNFKDFNHLKKFIQSWRKK